MKKPIPARRAAAALFCLPLVHLLAAGCSDASRNAGAGSDAGPNAAANGCDADERVEGTGCVPIVFDEAIIPPPTNASDIATDGARIYVKNTLLVFFKAETTTVEQAKAVLGPQGGEIVGALPFASMFRVRFADAPDLAGLTVKTALLGSDPSVAAMFFDEIAPGSMLAAVRAENDLEKIPELAEYEDFSFGSTHNFNDGFRGPYETIGAPAAWSAIYDANPPLKPVTIAALDGFVAKSPTFAGLPLKWQIDMRVLGDYTADDFLPRHGTAVSAVIGAPNDGRGTNGIVAGVPKEAGGSCVPYDLAPMAVLARWAGGDGMQEDVLFFALTLAVKTGARVVNASLAGNYGASLDTSAKRKPFADTVRRIAGRAKKTLFVFAAGNDGVEASEVWPASAARTDEAAPPNIMSVAAIDQTGHQAVWTRGNETKRSNFDSKNNGSVTITAPGTAVVSEVPNGKLTGFAGTSAAAPMVSGSAALLFAIQPALTGGQVKDMLLASAAPLPKDAFPFVTTQPKRLDIGKAVNDLIQKMAGDGQAAGVPSQLGKGDCRKTTTNAASCRRLLDPNADDPNTRKRGFGYKLKVTGTMNGKPYASDGFLSFRACSPRDPNPLEFQVIISPTSVDGKSVDGLVCDSATNEEGSVTLSSPCVVPDIGWAPGASYSQPTPSPKAESCQLACPGADGSATVSEDIKGGAIDWALSADCKSLTGKWKPAASCTYDLTFTATLDETL